METQTTQPQVNPLFAFHKLNTDGMNKSQMIADAFHNFIQDIHQITFGNVNSTQPNWEGREWAIVKTKLEEACFFAKKAMATRPENQETQN